MIIDEDSTTQWILEDEDDLILQDLSNLQLTNSEDEPYYSILCVDIGVVNLGLAALIGDPTTLKFRRVVGVDLLDITKIPHPPEIPECTCSLNHSRTFSTYLSRFRQTTLRTRRNDRNDGRLSWRWRWRRRRRMCRPPASAAAAVASNFESYIVSDVAIVVNYYIIRYP